MTEILFLGVFSAALLGCVLGGQTILYAMVFGFLLFLAYGLRRSYTAAQVLRMAIDAEIDRRLPQRVVLDFAGVGFMDSSGIGLILGRQRHVQALGGSLGIRRPPAQIIKVLELAGIENMEEAKR